MLDIQFIREHAAILQDVAKAKGIDVSIETLLALDERRRELLHRVETYRRDRNVVSRQIAQALREAAANQTPVQQDVAGQAASDGLLEPDALKRQARRINEQLVAVEAEQAAVEAQFHDLMLWVPNIVSPDTPLGDSDADNVEAKRVGVPPTFDFDPLDHVALMQSLDMLDVERGVKIAGSRGYVLKNAGLQLHRGVQQLAIDLLAARGFTVMDVPVLVRGQSLDNTGFFPSGRDQTYELPRDDLWLVGTSEVPLVSFFAGEVVDVRAPIRMAGVSNCFRREAGSAGRDVRGLYRVHQFAKVEQVVLCENDVATSLALFEELTRNAEDLLEMLELPYRIVSVCTGDLSQKNYKQIDIETWMPSRGAYGETHSSSMLLDFQARRSNIRYRDRAGRLRFCHTLNNTAVATPRILIPLLEVHQREDGSVYVPPALRKYLGGREVLQA